VLTQFPGKPEVQKVTFATFFRRPGRFRFEWTTHHPPEIAQALVFGIWLTFGPRAESEDDSIYDSRVR